MKKVYIICFFILSAAIVFGLSYFYSKQNMGISENGTQILNETEGIAEIVTKQASYEETKITNITTIKLQVNDLNNNTFEEKIINTPVEFLEMTRSDLLEYMKEYLKSPNEEDEKRGLLAYELVEFSKKSVVLRKTYKMEEMKETQYKAMLENGYVTIYAGDDNVIYDYTDISLEDLPEDIKVNLKKGIIFNGEKELYEFLETYSS